MLDEMTHTYQEEPKAKKRTPAPIAGSLLYLTVLILLLLSSVLTRELDTDGSSYYVYLLLTQLLTIGLPTLIFVLWGKKDIKYSLRFGRTSLAEILLSIGMAIFGYGVIIALNLLWVLFLSQFGTPKTSTIPPIDTGKNFLAALGVIALAPAVLEEFMFRGFIQRGYERGGKVISILLTGVMFAFLHISILSIPAIVLMGILLCFIAYRSNTVWTSMTYHFTNNAIAMSLLYLSSLFMRFLPEDMEGVSTSLTDIPYEELVPALVAWGVIGFFALLLFGACLAGFIMVTRGKQAEVKASMAKAKARFRWTDILPVVFAIVIIIWLLISEVIQMVNPAPIL
ncbi:MAG: type II CAAX endopeptidase family protein [Clostridia bacterium]|nr:type II CAAX endopeptidase family protein [Clostridia bacterium]